ncbi:MAG: 2-oxoacid:acceptor oxidoreductase subunit alpha [Chloroflexota bacterium]|nr:MAG: 2-oxoacid:acceptor oxidoreductase subunit alpha [Chloroflexota bacterium]
MPQVDFTVRVGGDSATGGIVTTGEIVARIAAFSGLEIYTTRTIPAEIKGGHVMFQLRTSEEPVYSQGDEVDMLIAFDQESIDNYDHLVKPGGFLIYNSNDGKPPPRDDIKQYALPLNDIARKINFSRGRNIITIGAMVKLFDLPYDKAEEVVRRQLGRKKELLDQNLLALKTGYDYVEQNIAKESPYHLIPESGGVQDERLVMNGNQALSMGAIAGGCRFYAGYPITPASDIMEFLAAEFPQIKGTMIQAEDEIAAINMCLGGSFAGARSMTATSGPGVALMVEALGHATMTEIPLVVVDVQRAGPSTGMPTKVSQGDLRLAIFGAADDAPRIVVAPVSVEDCFYQMVNAFNLAEKYQTPVIFLSDQDMSVRVVTLPPFDMERVHLEPRLLWDPNSISGNGNGASPNGSGEREYLRYKLTEDGVSPMSLPGMPGGQYTAEGLEKAESGAPIYTPEAHARNFHKRARKLANAIKDYNAWEMYETFGDLDAPLAIVGWGSTIGPVKEAVLRAQSEGMSVAVLYPKLLYPMPVEHIGEFIANREKIIVPELNFTGQFGRMLQAQFEREIIPLTRYGGTPLAARDVYAMIKQVYQELKVKA